ncbi:MAG: endonuclease/exonuclease/phosphatase family protein [Jatrophihabitans sp.]
MKLRVGTWNVQYGWGAEKNARRLELLRRLDADIWVLTETNDALDLSSTHRAVSTQRRFPVEPGSRWVTIWSRLALAGSEITEDSDRTVAARFTTLGGTEVLVYGTVLPWMHDKGPDPSAPAQGWSELHRVTPIQGAEWLRLRTTYAEAVMVVAGDLNQNLGGNHYYGTQQSRTLLRAALAAASLECLTTTERFAPGELDHPPIDCVCVGAPHGRRLHSVVTGWNNTTADGHRLSDHSGVLAEFDL